MQQILQQRCPAWRWDVTNQAGVHLWYRDQGRSFAPFHSTCEAIACWPETATTLGVRLQEDDQLSLFAACGWEDVWKLILRHNPARVSYATFLQRVQEKRFLQRWPGLRLV